MQKAKNIFGKIGKGISVLMPYMSLIAVILCIINLFYISRVQSEIDDLDYSIHHISTDYDNSDVINAIEDAEGNINSNIEDAEGNLKRQIIIWGN